MEELFLDLRDRGLTAEGLASLFPPPAYFTAWIDGEAVPAKAELMPALAGAFRFPSYFGGNWDALLDCLRSLPLVIKPASGYVLAVRNSGAFLAASTRDKENFAEVAAEAGAFLRDGPGLRFIVALL